jgi:hypothetical protein
MSQLLRFHTQLLEADEGEWLTLRGVHVMIGDDGHIIKGPPDFVGKHPDELNGISGHEPDFADEHGGRVETPKTGIVDKLKGAAQEKVQALGKFWKTLTTKEGRAELVNNVKSALKSEATQTKVMASTMLKMARRQPVTDEEKTVAIDQLKDIATLALLLSLKGQVASSAIGVLGKSTLFKGATSKLLMKKAVTKATKTGLKKALGRKGVLPSSFDEQHEASGQMTPEEYIAQIVADIVGSIDIDSMDFEGDEE